ncbi:MAG: DUF2309 domain-containing protein [Myxococcales bacterium]|nr:DUF2309 domain-containing protein [Myxococcales bacterium]
MSGEGGGGTRDVDPILEAVERAAHGLPDQGPIGVFIHHNTLHAYEHLPFHEAICKASRDLGTEAYMSEEAFRAAYARGRIEDVDLDESIARHAPPPPRAMSRGRWAAFVRAALLVAPCDTDEAGVTYLVEEGDALASPGARAYWTSAGRHVARWREPSRPRDRADVHDSPVDAFLVPLAAAYLDVGAADWPLPFEGCFYEAARELVAASRAPEPWLQRARDRFADERARGITAVDAVREVLSRRRLGAHGAEAFVRASLRRLPGWAGMFRRLEREPARTRPASLVDYLAVRLVLEEAAERRSGERPSPERVENRASLLRRYQLFCLLQCGAVRDDADDVRDALAGLAVLDRDARGRVWHEAYESRYRRQVLSALATGVRADLARRAAGHVASRPAVQLIVCIDDREESLRRHIEELAPSWETLGAAGFFGLAIAHQAHEGAEPSSLCPANQRPTHRIVEPVVTSPTGPLARTWARFTALLAPGVGARRTQAENATARPPATFSRADEAEAPEGTLPLGFTAPEAAERVGRLLREVGVAGRLAPLVFVLGHGSTNRNNPHASAYDCGACGGQRGGPNARAFAALANDPRVRECLAGAGVVVPEDTVFVGGFHDTANDDVTLYDLDGVPSTHRDALAEARRTFDRARALDAHERCRRFESAPLDLDPASALTHVRRRAEDHAEPRPECGHGTHAFAVVGRREISRGLFLDRRAFLVSYDSSVDADGAALARVCSAAVPVGAGISLEYYFSFVDNARYGSGTKLPHNVASLLGVMDGARSDLRTGLPWQMVEIHEPMRLLVVIEAPHEHVLRAAAASEAVQRLVVHEWVRVATIDPTSGAIHLLDDGKLVPFDADDLELPEAPSSAAYYAGERDHLRPARILAEATTRAAAGAHA